MSRFTEVLVHRYYPDTPDRINGQARYVNLLDRHVCPCSQVLDIGPSDGSGFTHATHLRSCKVTGIDPDPAVLRNKSLADAVVGQAEHMPFDESTFDAVVCYYSLEHIDDPATVLAEIHRVLKPGGVLVFRTPNLWHYVTICSALTPAWLRDRLFALATGSRTHSERFRTHYRFNTRRRIRKLADALGFEVVSMDMYEALPAYAHLCTVTFLLGMLYERVVTKWSVFAGFRVNILGVLRKRGGESGGRPVEHAPGCEVRACRLH